MKPRGNGRVDPASPFGVSAYVGFPGSAPILGAFPAGRDARAPRQGAMPVKTAEGRCSSQNGWDKRVVRVNLTPRKGRVDPPTAKP